LPQNKGEEERQIFDPLYQRKASKQIILSSRNPTLKSVASFAEMEFAHVFNNPNIDKKIRDSECVITPKIKREKIKIAIINPDFQKTNKKPKTDEELKDMDDNDIIEQLINFTGVMNLWYCLNLQER